MKRYSNRRSPNGGLNTSTLSDHVSNSESSGSSQSESAVRCESLGDDTVLIASPTSDPSSSGKSDEDTPSISFATSYCVEWEKLFMRPDFLKPLRESGIEGRLRSCRFRSVCWKVYLEVLPTDFSQWVSKTQEWRQRYEDLKNRLIVNPRQNGDETTNPVLHNPLSQSDESPWNRFFQDNELRLTIKQDVIRTYPKIEFFHTDEIRSMMVDALFIYAKVHPDVSYRQGMHELLAPLIFVLHCDHQAFLHACEIEQVGIIKLPPRRDVLQEVLDPKYIEHDAFALFCQIMETAEHWYVSKELSPTIRPKNAFKAQPFARPQDMNPSNVIVNKLTRIQDYLLKKYDPELHLYLEKMEIPPQIYGIRWVRLLFGREFPMQDILVLWDAIFADSISFDLVDYVFVAMLLYLRDALLTSDYPTCLHFLMKYPPVGDINHFIQKALFLREPNDHYCPPPYTYQKPASLMHSSYGDMFPGANGLPATILSGLKQSVPTKGGTKIAEKASSFMSGFASLGRKLSSQQQKARRQMSLPTSNSMSRSDHVTTSHSERASPASDILPHPSHYMASAGHSRKGSTASLSQLEDRIAPYLHGSMLHGAASNQSLARTDLSSAGSAASLEDQSHMEYMHLESRYGTTLPRRGTGSSGNGDMRSGSRGFTGKRNISHTARNSDLEQRISFLLGRLNDIESMCSKCADKMEVHIDKLQGEMLRRDMDNEDELLLALAGLKVVKDVLKGELKPSAIFFDDEIRINDNHYREESPAPIQIHPQASADSPDGGRTSGGGDVGSNPGIRSPQFSSDLDLGSPDEATILQVSQAVALHMDTPQTPSAILHKDLLHRKEVEMSSFELPLDASGAGGASDNRGPLQRDNDTVPQQRPLSRVKAKLGHRDPHSADRY